MTSFFFMILGAALVLVPLLLRKKYISFVAQSPEDYAQSGETFELTRHLNGPIDCDGVIYGPTGRVTSRFRAEFDAHWDGNQGGMREHFHYDTGVEQVRQWSLTLLEDGRIEATAPDVIGVGTGRQMGSAVVLNYRIKLPEQSGGHVLNAVDWMYLTPNGTIMNRSQLSKFGIQVAEIVAVMRPRQAQERKLEDAA